MCSNYERKQSYKHYLLDTTIVSFECLHIDINYLRFLIKI